MRDDLLNEALEANKNGKMEEWIHAFLNTNGRNKILSDGLRKEKRYWLGPLEVNLSLLNRIQGPADDAENSNIEEKWLNRINPMISDLALGWQPAPLIAEYKQGKLMIRDGGHRIYSLKKAGFLKYWTIIWANSENDYLKTKDLLSL